MFERPGKSKVPPELPPDAMQSEADLITWATLHGIGYQSGGESGSFSLTGLTDGWPWKIERLPTSRDYIAGFELRARVETRADEDAAVIVMNRALKDVLEEQAYSLYTDSVQTEARPVLIEEMRWLAAYPEVGWESLPEAFWARYAVAADRRSNAMAWITDEFGQALLGWANLDLPADRPFMMMLLRGKVHLRIQSSTCAPLQIAQVVELLNRASRAIHTARSDDAAA
jgi:hypothetical protein